MDHREQQPKVSIHKSHQPRSTPNLSLQAARMAHGHQGDPCPPPHHCTEEWASPPPPWLFQGPPPFYCARGAKNHDGHFTVDTNDSSTKQKAIAMGPAMLPARLPVACKAPAPGIPAPIFPAQGQIRLAAVVSGRARSRAGTTKALTVAQPGE